MSIPAEPVRTEKGHYILFALGSYCLCRFFSSRVVTWLKWKTFLEDFWHCSDEESGIRRGWRTPTTAGVTLASNKSSDSIMEWKKLIMKRWESSGRRRTLTNTLYKLRWDTGRQVWWWKKVQELYGLEIDSASVWTHR